MPVYAIPFNFNKFLQDTEFSLLNNSANTKNAFDLLQNFSKREEVDIEKLSIFLLQLSIQAIKRSDLML
jgi:hypothetical protein